MDCELLDLRGRDLLVALSSEDPAPGGGSAAALAVAQAAATLCSAARRSSWPWEGGPGAVAQAEALRERAASLVQLDAEAYERAAAALDERSIAGADAAISRALDRAVQTPMTIAEAAADAATLAVELADQGDPDARGDAVSACLLAEGAGRAACHLVEINLSLVEADPRRAAARRLATSLQETASRLLLERS